MTLSKKELKIPGCEPITIKDMNESVGEIPGMSRARSSTPRRRRSRSSDSATGDQRQADLRGEQERVHLEYLTQFRNHVIEVNARRRGLVP